MSSDDAQAAAAGISRLAELLAAEPRLQPEIQRARREFFGQQAVVDGVVPVGDAEAEHRFAEWFALERDSETLGDIPIDVLPFAELEPVVGGSVASAFAVTSVSPHSATARDLQDDGMLDLVVPPGSLLPGDLVVGRLFPVGSGQWTPSTAAAVFRPGVELAKAFGRDLQRLDLKRRLRQVEIEHLLLRRPEQGRSPTAASVPTVPLERLEAELEQLLDAAGSELGVEAISAQLAAAARPGPVLGPLLEELAFDTSIDLDRTRTVLLEIWNAHHRDDDPGEVLTPTIAPRAAPPGATLGEQLASALERGLAEKQDVEALFAQLGRMAGIDPAELDDEDDSAAAAMAEADEFAAVEGNLGPLVEEYLWEQQRQQVPGATALRQWADLQQNAPVPRTDVEQITPSDVVRLLLHVYLGAAPGAAAATVRTAFDELRAFADWLTATQEIALGPALDGCQGSFLDQLDRLQAAGEALSTAETPRTRPGMLHVDTIAAGGFGASDDDGVDHWVKASATALQQLRSGDLVLGALVPTGGNGPERRLAGRAVVLPQDARTLME